MWELTVIIYELIGVQRLTLSITLILHIRRTSVQLETGFKSKKVGSYGQYVAYNFYVVTLTYEMSIIKDEYGYSFLYYKR